jgi:hypothetical protein
MHAGITAITELAVKSRLTNRLPPEKAKQSFFRALSRFPNADSSASLGRVNTNDGAM